MVSVRSEVRGDYGGIAESVEQRIRRLSSGSGTLAPFGGWGARGLSLVLWSRASISRRKPVSYPDLGGGEPTEADAANRACETI